MNTCSERWRSWRLTGAGCSTTTPSCGPPWSRWVTPVLSSCPLSEERHTSSFSCSPQSGGFGNDSPGPDLACSPFLKIKLSRDAPVFVTKIEWPTVPEVLQKTRWPCLEARGLRWEGAGLGRQTPCRREPVSFLLNRVNLGRCLISATNHGTRMNVNIFYV